MSFSLNIVKDDEGNLSVEHYHTNTDAFPDKIQVNGHVDDYDGKVVDLSVRVTGLFASASRREYPI